MITKRKFALGQNAGVAIAEALGLQANRITGIDLHFAVGEIVTAEVSMFVEDDQAAEIAMLLKKYELVEVDE